MTTYDAKTAPDISEIIEHLRGMSISTQMCAGFNGPAFADGVEEAVAFHADRYTILADSIRDGLAGVDGAASIADEDLADVVAAQVERAERAERELDVARAHHAAVAEVRAEPAPASIRDLTLGAITQPVPPDPGSEPEPARPRLVWLPDWTYTPGWHLCHPDHMGWLEAPYSAWSYGAVAFASLGATLERRVRVADLAAAAALCIEMAREDGYDVDPWPGGGE